MQVFAKFGGKAAPKKAAKSSASVGWGAAGRGRAARRGGARRGLGAPAPALPPAGAPPGPGARRNGDPGRPESREAPATPEWRPGMAPRARAGLGSGEIPRVPGSRAPVPARGRTIGRHSGR
jgi:hypothetical protein